MVLSFIGKDTGLSLRRAGFNSQQHRQNGRVSGSWSNPRRCKRRTLETSLVRIQPLPSIYASLAQSIERKTVNFVVVGLNPTGGANCRSFIEKCLTALRNYINTVLRGLERNVPARVETLLRYPLQVLFEERQKELRPALYNDCEKYAERGISPHYAEIVQRQNGSLVMTGFQFDSEFQLKIPVKEI